MLKKKKRFQKLFLMVVDKEMERQLELLRTLEQRVPLGKQDIVAVEYPGVVRNRENLIRTLGSYSAIQKVSKRSSFYLFIFIFIFILYIYIYLFFFYYIFIAMLLKVTFRIFK